jgi:hypothetical protein
VTKLRNTFRLAAWLIPLAWSLVPLTDVSADDRPVPAIVPAAKQPAPASARMPGECELIIEGKSVEKLVLLDPHGLTKEITAPRASVFLPPGRYVLQQIEFQGGFPLYPNEVLLLTPQTPTRLNIGKSLKPTVTAKRKGNVLKLDYRLLDAGGRNCANVYQCYPPRFDVYLGDEKIVSDKFEFG